MYMCMKYRQQRLKAGAGGSRQWNAMEQREDFTGG